MRLTPQHPTAPRSVAMLHHSKDRLWRRAGFTETTPAPQPPPTLPATDGVAFSQND